MCFKMLSEDLVKINKLSSIGIAEGATHTEADGTATDISLPLQILDKMPYSSFRWLLTN